MWNLIKSQKWFLVIFHEYLNPSIMPKFLSAMAWFTKENLIANSPKGVISMIAIQSLIIELLWPPPISVFITHASIVQSKNNTARIMPTRSSASIILLISFLLIIVQNSLKPWSSFFAHPRISGTNIAVVSRFASLVIRPITSFVVSEFGQRKNHQLCNFPSHLRISK